MSSHSYPSNETAVAALTEKGLRFDSKAMSVIPIEFLTAIYILSSEREHGGKKGA